jgi:hypothetical protein
MHRCKKSGCKLSLSYVQYSIYTAKFVIIFIILAYFPYLEKMKVGLCDRYAVCVSVNPPPPLTFEYLNQSL